MNQWAARAGAVMLMAGMLFAIGCAKRDVRSFEGTAEGDYLRVAAMLPGSLASLNVRPGERVEAGEPLIGLDARDEIAAQHDAELRLSVAIRRLEEARRAGDVALVQEANASVGVARSELTQAQWRVEQKMAKAPQEGVVIDALYTEGQWVPAGSAVVAIMSPEALKVRFFVSSRVAGTLRHGQTVRLRCDRCAAGAAAKITYVSPIAEAAVDGDGSAGEPRFLIEAKPMESAIVSLHPGSAVEVVL